MGYKGVESECVRKKGEGQLPEILKERIGCICGGEALE